MPPSPPGHFAATLECMTANATAAAPGDEPRRAATSRQGPRREPRRAAGTPEGRQPPVLARVSSPASLLAVIPALLGFSPGRSIVVIGTGPGNGQVRVTLRYDVPAAGQAAVVADDAVGMLTAQRLSTAVAVGYGTDAEVTPVMTALRDHAARSGIALAELLRAEGGRYWSYVCADPGCCPPEGTAFDVSRHPAARALRSAGAPVLPSREALAASVAAKGGQPGAVMRRATRESMAQFARCLRRLDGAGPPVSAARLVDALGQVAVRDAISRYRAGEAVPVAHAALITIALTQLRVRDDAWARMEPAHRAAHLRLWTDLTRLARPGYVAAPASLLAFVAWQSGNGALGNVALDRALADNPRYSLALLLRDALDSGAPPSLARLPMTPEEVAEAYDAIEREAETAPSAPPGGVGAGEPGQK